MSSTRVNLIGDASSLIRAFREALQTIRQSMGGMSAAVRAGMDRAIRDLERLEDQARRSTRRAGDDIDRLGRRAGGLSGAFKGAFKGVAGVAAGLGLGLSGLGIFEIGSEFERLRAVLLTLEGTTAAANARFADLQKFSQETPFELAEVVEAFSKLKSRGLDPSNEALRAYGNTAAAMGKSLDQMVEAVGDAATGEFERLKEFGIQASQSGDQVTFTFKGISTTVAKESGAIEGYLRRIGSTDFATGMSNQAETLGGKMSNLTDSVKGFADRLMQGGLSTAFKQIITDMTNVGAGSQDLAGSLGGVLGTAVTEMWGIFKSFGEGVSSVFHDLGNIIRDTVGTTTNDMGIWKVILGGVRVAFVFFGTGVRTVLSIVTTAVKLALSTIVGFGKMAGNALKLDVSGITDSYRAMSEEKTEIARKGAQDLIDIARQGAATSRQIVLDSVATPQLSEEVELAKGKKTPPKKTDADGDGKGKGKKTRATKEDDWVEDLVAKNRAALAEYERNWAESQAKVTEMQRSASLMRAQAEITAEERKVGVLAELGLVTQQQKLTAEAEFENQRYELQMTAMNQRLEMLALDPTMNPEEYQRIKNEMLEIELAHQAQMAEINDQVVLASTERQRGWINQTSQLFGDQLAKLATVQQSFGAFVGNIWKGLLSIVTGAIAQILQDWIAAQLAAFIFGKATKTVDAVGKITAYAGVAAAGAYSAIAAIPIVGPGLAPAAAGAAFAGAMSFLPAASAAGGFDIPTGVNPVTQLHQEEMVLPANIANPLRGMLEGGGDRGLNLTIQAMDSEDVYRLFMQNKGDVVAAIKSAVRDGFR